MSEGLVRLVWETLPTERQRSAVLALGLMAMRQIRAPETAQEMIPPENADDRRGSHAAFVVVGLPEKIFRRHRERLAIVYIRQSTPQQVERHQESTRLQYALVEMVAQNDGAYVATAVRLASDSPALATLRAGLRARVERSPLLDKNGLARGGRVRLSHAVARLVQTGDSGRGGTGRCC